MVTLKTISEKTGFSLSVVSRALNPCPDQRVAESTKRKIERAVQELNYRRNHTASLLARGKSTAIGVFLPYYPDSLLVDLVVGVTEKANECDFLCNFYFGMNSQDYVEFMGSVEEVGSSGILSYLPHVGFSSTELGRILQKYHQDGGRLLFMNSAEYPELGIQSLNIDNFSGGLLAAEHLFGRGCQDYICISPSSESWQSEQRRAGFFSFLEEKCVHPEIFYAESRSGYQNYLLQTIETMVSLNSSRKVGIFALSDYLAMDIAGMLIQRGLHAQIGQRFLIIGYDDLPACRHCIPALTTIRQPFRELGRRGIELLVGMITSTETGSKDMLQPELVIRESA
ncbi:MAG: LacI family transcriptional regulator [Oligosphaeraceae bacterium]|nr:LacI family transcriptional regulator [Oligosphaeraceae bacterium]